MSVVAILLAAGSSRRFGGDKLRARYRGRPLWRHALDALADSPGLAEVLAVVRPNFRAGPLPPRCRLVHNPEHEQGMGASLRIGVAAAPADATGYLVALADMPHLTPGRVASLLDVWGGAEHGILVPVFDGRRGHPVIFGGAFRAALLECHGDVGGRDLLREHAPAVIEWDTTDRAVVFDVDLPLHLGGRKR
jgi:molybdenum cofactor cytidylyltransferase